MLFKECVECVEFLGTEVGEVCFFPRVGEEIERYESMIFNEIGERTEFFFPDNMREFIKKGNIKEFKEQYRKYRNAKVKDQRLKPLRMLLIQHQRAFNMNGYLPL